MRQPRLRIRAGGGLIVYDVRLDHLLHIEALTSGRAPVFAGGFTFELVEGAAGEKIIARETYMPQDFPRFDDAAG